MRKMKEFHTQSIFLLVALFQGIHGQLTVPPNSPAALGDNVSLVCTTTEINPTFTWTYRTNGQSLYIGNTRGTNAERYANIVLQEGTDTQTSILNINDIQLEDEGEYLCSTVSETDTPPVTQVTVEVQSTRTLSVANPLVHNMEYNTTCEVLGGKPDETITWMLDDGEAPCNSFDNPLPADPGLFSKISVCTFQADREDNGKILKCVISGHQVPELNGEERTPLNITYAPDDGVMVVSFQTQGTDLRVLCDIADENQPNPVIMNYYIYSNGTLKHQSTTGENFVDLGESEFDLSTDFHCVAGNYLGNTTSPTARYKPERPTAPPPTTESITTEGSTTELREAPAETTSPETNDAGKSTGPTTGNVGAIVGGVVGGIVLIIIIVLVIKFVVKPECMGGSGSNSGGSRKKPASSAVGSSNGSEKDKIKPSAAPRTQSSIQHTTDNPEQAEYAMVDRKPGGGGKGGGDMPDKGYGAGQNEPAGMVYADLDLSAKAGHTEKQIPQNKDDVVVYSSILV